MLQQTQVATALPYFQRFMRRFPDAAALAAAPLEDVLRVWAGLGYYSRARNLHRAAGVIVARHGGLLPDSLEQLQSLPGIGRYTAGAIRSIAFNKPAPILDGNVTRVLCRLFAIDGDPKSPAIQRRLWSLAESLVAPRRPAAFNQAMMELGALVCTPVGPGCYACPLAGSCQAKRLGRQGDFPAKGRKARVRAERWAVALVQGGEQVLMSRRDPSGRWGGLWEFPGVVVEGRGDGKVELRGLLRERFELSHLRLARAGRVRHRLTHRDMTVEVFAAATSKRRRMPSFAWVDAGRITARPVSTLTRKIAALL
jgi:A/G-specific adenine glycosylase